MIHHIQIENGSRHGRKDPEEQVRTKEIKEQKKMLKKDQEFRPSDKQLRITSDPQDPTFNAVRT